MTNFTELLGQVTPAEATAIVCLRGDLMGRYDELVADLAPFEDWEPSSLSDVDPRLAIRAELQGLHEQMKAATHRFRFRTIGEKAFSDLQAKHPAPKPEDDSPAVYDWNPQTFPVALIAAACVEPAMTEDQVGQLFDRLSLDQRNEIFAGAYRAQVRQVDIPFYGAASAPAASTEQN